LAEARRRARAEFGAVEVFKDECRQARGLQLMDELRQDVRYAARQMARSPVFTIAAVVSLALGIGANTAIFSVMDAVFFRNLALRSPHQLYFLGHTSGSDLTTSANYPLYERYRDAGLFAGVTAYSGESFLVSTDEGVARVNGQFASGNYHDVLGVPFILGRGFRGESDRAIGASPIAVISEAYWSAKFGRDPDVIGRTLVIRGLQLTIVGVTAPAFDGLYPGFRVDVTVPLSVRALGEPSFLDARDGWTSLSLVARLVDDMSVEQATAAVGPLFTRFWMEPENAWARRGPFADARIGVVVPAARGSGELRGRYGSALGILMGMVATLLLIACVNLANLFHARATARTREVTVRLGLGASRFRLIRQFLTESCLLAAVGGALGLIVAYWSARSLVSFVGSGPFPVLLDVSLNGKVLGFTAAISALTGAAFGLLPALRSTRVDLITSLKQTGASPTRRGEAVAGHVLVAGQIALCMVLVAACGLLVRSLRNLNAVETGFARDNVLLFDIETVRSAEQRPVYFAVLLERMRALPGVQSAALAMRSPVDFSMQLRRIEVPGFTPPPGTEGVSSNTVTPEYFRTLDIALLRGRGFTDQDRQNRPKVALASESMARAWFGNTEAIGRDIVLGGNQDTLTIVGIVADARHEGIRETAPPTVYTPLTQPGEAFDGSVSVPANLTVLLRTRGDVGTLTTALVDSVRALGADAVVSWIRTMEQQMAVTLTRERLLAHLSTAFAILALLLATTGLYGVMSYNMARRRRDIGIRMALGATRAALVRHVLRDVLVLSLAGIAAGSVLTFASTRVVASFLFGVGPNDPVTLSAVATLLLGTILAAGYLPARQAAALDPMRTLRVD
jgi:predicted permease